MPDGRPDPDAPLTIAMPVDVRSVALTIVGVLSLIVALRLGRDLFIPLTLGILLSLVLDGPVTWLARIGVPRSLGALAVILMTLATGGFALYTLADDAVAVLSEIPETSQQIREAIQRTRQQPQGAADTLRRAAEEIDRTVEEVALPGEPPTNVTRVQIENEPFRVGEYLALSTGRVLSLISLGTVVVFLVYFLLLSGDLFKRKLVRIAGPALARKKITLRILEEIREQVERFLVVRIFTTAAVGLLTGVLLWVCGLERAALWGLVTGILNLVPYFGPVMATAAVSMSGLLQFEDVGMAATVGLVTFSITGLEGMLLTPALIGKAAKMNTVAVFVGLLVWGWLWGFWGLLLAVPLIMILKATCMRIEALQPLGELLGE